MTNREKIIEWANKCTSSEHKTEDCNECPYKLNHEESYSCIEGLLRDMLMPKDPIHFRKEYDEHEWKKNADGEPDEWAWMFDIHNGPVCERCGFSFCEGCNPNGWNMKKCYIDYFSCPACRKQIDKGQKFCDKCGQFVKWNKK